MGRHTPGPWEADSDNDLIEGDEIAVRPTGQADYGGVIAVVWPWGDDEVGTAERDANARLIAASPTMLEALERIVGMCDVPGTCTCGRPNGLPAVVQAARAAIRAATGEP